jgi:hypothetical protein
LVAHTITNRPAASAVIVILMLSSIEVDSLDHGFPGAAYHTSAPASAGRSSAWKLPRTSTGGYCSNSVLRLLAAITLLRPQPHAPLAPAPPESPPHPLQPVFYGKKSSVNSTNYPTNCSRAVNPEVEGDRRCC